MKKGFLKHANDVIKSSHIIIEVVDARFPLLTRKKKLEKKIIKTGKKLLIVLNKTDLIKKNNAFKEKKEIEKEFPCVVVSTKKKYGLKTLRKKIGIVSKKKNVLIGIIGYPNTGKSSLINALKGKRAAGTGFSSGFTKGKQLIKITNKIRLIDSPGIIPLEEKNEFFLALTSAKTSDKIKDPVNAALKLIDYLKKNTDVLEKKFKINESNPDKILKLIALKKKKLLRKGKPDLTNTAKIIIHEWQKNSLR